MEILKEEGSVVSGITGHKHFQIEMNAKMHDILSKNLYSDKHGSVIREICCNAKDAHTVIGKAHIPFEVQLPTKLDPTFSVRDFGPGMPNEIAIDLYSTLGKSTKTQSNDMIGAWGLGSKSPFAITDAFNVENTYDGTTYMYMCFKDENGFPSILDMGSIKDDRPSGVKVSIPVEERDFDLFKNKINRQLICFDPKPKVVNGFVFEFKKPIVEDSALEELGVYLLGNAKEFGINTRLCARMGDVIYPIDVSSVFDDTDEDYKIKSQLNAYNEGVSLVINFKIGEVQPSPSRESLEYSRKTIATIKERVTLELLETLDIKDLERVRGSKTLEELCDSLNSINSEYKSRDRIIDENNIKDFGLKMANSRKQYKLDYYNRATKLEVSNVSPHVKIELDHTYVGNHDITEKNSYNQQNFDPALKTNVQNQYCAVSFYPSSGIRFKKHRIGYGTTKFPSSFTSRDDFDRHDEMISIGLDDVLSMSKEKIHFIIDDAVDIKHRQNRVRTFADTNLVYNDFVWFIRESEVGLLEEKLFSLLRTLKISKEYNTPNCDDTDLLWIENFMVDNVHKLSELPYTPSIRAKSPKVEKEKDSIYVYDLLDSNKTQIDITDKKELDNVACYIEVERNKIPVRSNPYMSDALTSKLNQISSRFVDNNYSRSLNQLMFSKLSQYLKIHGGGKKNIVFVSKSQSKELKYLIANGIPSLNEHMNKAAKELLTPENIEIVMNDVTFQPKEWIYSRTNRSVNLFFNDIYPKFRVKKAFDGLEDELKALQQYRESIGDVVEKYEVLNKLDSYLYGFDYYVGYLGKDNTEGQSIYETKYKTKYSSYSEGHLYYSDRFMIDVGRKIEDYRKQFNKDVTGVETSYKELIDKIETILEEKYYILYRDWKREIANIYRTSEYSIGDLTSLMSYVNMVDVLIGRENVLEETKEELVDQPESPETDILIELEV